MRGKGRTRFYDTLCTSVGGGCRRKGMGLGGQCGEGKRGDGTELNTHLAKMPTKFIEGKGSGRRRCVQAPCRQLVASPSPAKSSGLIPLPSTTFVFLLVGPSFGGWIECRNLTFVALAFPANTQTCLCYFSSYFQTGYLQAVIPNGPFTAPVQTTLCPKQHMAA